MLVFDCQSSKNYFLGLNIFSVEVNLYAQSTPELFGFLNSYILASLLRELMGIDQQDTLVPPSRQALGYWVTKEFYYETQQGIANANGSPGEEDSKDGKEDGLQKRQTSMAVASVH